MVIQPLFSSKLLPSQLAADLADVWTFIFDQQGT